MKINKSYIGSYLLSFCKIFISYAVVVFIMYTVVTLFTDIEYMSLELIFFSALGFCTAYSFAFIVKTETISISDKNDFIIKLKKVIEKKNYTVVNEESNIIVIRPHWIDRLFTSDVIIQISNNEAKLTGALRNVKGIKDNYENMMAVNKK